MDESRVSEYLRDAASEGEEHHKLWLVVNCLVLPFSLLAGVLPGPNVFLWLNAYRLYSHWAALRGHTALVRLMNEGRVDCEPSAQLAAEAAGGEQALRDAFPELNCFDFAVAAAQARRAQKTGRL
jgi:hypothetical protein